MLSLSTMWAQQERFADIRDFARAARDLGYDAIEVNYTVAPEAFAALTNGRILPGRRPHAPPPRHRGVREPPGRLPARRGGLLARRRPRRGAGPAGAHRPAPLARCA